MSMLTNTLGRYFAGRFMVAALGVFVSIFLLLVLVDYIEMVRQDVGACVGIGTRGRGNIAFQGAPAALRN